MNFNFSEDVNNFLKIIAKSALKQNKRVFFVGGIVRDNILNVKSDDVDILVLGDAIEFSKNLPDDIKIKSFHQDFCTAKVLYNNLVFDIASTRSEKYPHSGCLPVLEKIGVELSEDVKRRDFAVNSIYCELKLLNNELNFKLIDLVDGVNDIKNKTLKVLHDKSYIDDPTRILRGVGFKYRFGFDFSDHDKILIQKYFSHPDVSNASHDRIYAVFKKILSFKNNFQIFSEIVEKKYYKMLFKNDLNIDLSCIQKIISKFSLDEKLFGDFALLVLKNDEVVVNNLSNPVDIYNFFSKFDKNHLAYYYYKTKDENALKFLQYKNIKLLTNGKELLKLGYKQGKIFKIILNNLLNEKLKQPGLFGDLEAEKAWISNHYPLV